MTRLQEAEVGRLACQMNLLERTNDNADSIRPTVPEQLVLQSRRDEDGPVGAMERATG